MILNIILATSLLQTASAVCNGAGSIAPLVESYCFNQFYSLSPLDRATTEVNRTVTSQGDIKNQIDTAETFTCNEIERKVLEVRSEYEETVEKLGSKLDRSLSRVEQMRKHYQRLDESLRVKIMKAQEGCAGFWHNNVCFWSVFRDKSTISYKGAQRICRKNRGSTLASIVSETHYNKIVNYLRERGNQSQISYFTAWTGMKRDIPSGVTTLSNGQRAPYVKSLDSFRWSMEYEKDVNVYILVWTNSSTTELEGFGNAAPTTKLSAVLCQSLYPVPVEKDVVTEADPTPEIHGIEDCSGFKYNGSCYWSVFPKYGKITFKEATASCNRDGRSRVADIYSKSLYEKVDEYIRYVRRRATYGYIFVWTALKGDYISGVTKLSNGYPAPYVPIRRPQDWRPHNREFPRVFILVRLDKRARDKGFGKYRASGDFDGVLCQYS